MIGFDRIGEEQWRILRYLAVGGWNTVFGVGLYALCYRLFGREVNYLLLAVPVNVLSITNAFLCYKLIVFRTRGHWLREYWRCYFIYGGGALLSMGLLALLVSAAGMAPDFANLLASGIVVAVSYFGHKYFSFRASADEKNQSLSGGRR